jgi:hypothetical protein
MKTGFLHPIIAEYTEESLSAIMYLFWSVLAWVDFVAGITSRVVAIGCWLEDEFTLLR